MAQFKQDKMSSQERMTAVLSRQPVDRVPFYSLAFGFCTLNCGYTIADAYNDIPKASDAQNWAVEQYNWDEYTNSGYAAFGPWEFGGDVKWPSGEFAQSPMPAAFPVETEEDAMGLKMPDVETAGYLPLFVDFAERQQKVKHWYSYCIGHPFTAAANLCGPDKFSKWVLKKPDVANHMLRLMTDYLIEMYNYLKGKFGTDRLIPWFGDPTAANQVISPGQFEKFALPFNQELHQKIIDMGFKNILCHICGEQNENYVHWAKIPMGDPGIISVSHEVDLEKAIEYFPNDIIMGNIEPATIQTGTPQEVYELTRKTIEKGKKAPGGFILGPGCEFPPRTPPYNAWMIMKALNDFGWY